MEAKIVHGLTPQICKLAGFGLSINCSGCGKTSGGSANDPRVLVEIWDRLRCSDCGAPIHSITVDFRPGDWATTLDVLTIRRLDPAQKTEVEAVCNDYRLRLSVDEIDRAFSEIRFPLKFSESRPNLEPRDDIRITDTAPVIVGTVKGEFDLTNRRWSWPGADGAPVYNFRSEGRAFRRGRCLIPCDAFYEFTDRPPGTPKRARKPKWAFRLAGEPLTCIAGIVRGHEEVGPAFTMLTTSAGPDMAPYHSRQVVVIPQHEWAAWLLGGENEDRLLRALPGGSLAVERVEEPQTDTEA